MLTTTLDRVDNLPQKALSLLDFIVNPWTTDAFKLSLIPVSEVRLCLQTQLHLIYGLLEYTVRKLCF